MQKYVDLSLLHTRFEELVEMHHEKVRGLVAKVQDLYVRGLLNNAQADAYIRELRRGE